MVNSWIADEWGGKDGAHRDFLREGLSDLCTYRPASPKGEAVVDVPNCQAYVEYSETTSNGTSITVTKDQALIRVLKYTTDDPPVAVSPPPVAGALLIFGDVTFKIANRQDANEDSWLYLCLIPRA